MIDISKFVNSKDILHYWEEIDCIKDFTPIQLAYIVYQSKKATLKEKQDKYKEIISTCNDVILDNNRQYKGISFFSLLNNYIAFQDKIVEKFYEKEAHSCYTIRTWEKDDSYGDYHDSDKVFSSPDIALQEEKDDAVVMYKVIKKYIDSEKCIDVTFNRDMEIMSVFVSYFDDVDNIQDFLDYFYFSFPLPFKKGDILTDHTHYFTYRDSTVVFVLDELLDNDPSYRNKHLEFGDCSDMIALCYQQYGEEGKIIYDHRHNILDYEYFRGELDGRKRILKSISSYLKGKINLELLLIAYHQIIMEESVNISRADINWFTKDALEAAGLSEKQKT